MGNNKRLVRELTAQGFEVSRSKSGHYLVRKDGRLVATLATNPKDWRGQKNAIAYLRRAGFVWPPGK